MKQNWIIHQTQAMTYFQVESLPVLYLFLFHSEFALQKENRKTIMVATVIGVWNSLTFPRKKRHINLWPNQLNWHFHKQITKKESVIIKRTEKRWITSHFPNISFSSDFSPRFKFPWLKAKSPDIQLTSTGLALIMKKFIFLRQFPDLQQPWQWNTAIISSFFDQVPS